MPRILRPKPYNRQRDHVQEPPSRFTAEVLQNLRADIVSQRIPLNQTSLSDDVVKGLRAIVRKSGQISFHVQYTVNDYRAYLLIGHFPSDEEIAENPKAANEAIEDARNLCRTILHLGHMGIDVQEGLHLRLLQELRTKGTKWRP